MLGFGSHPAGSVSAGLGSPDTTVAPGGKLFREPTYGYSTGSRFIDPLTKDYRFDEYGRIVGMDDVKQLVYLAVSTTQGTAAMRDLGQTIRLIQRVTSNIETRVEFTLRNALRRLTDAGLIEVDGVSVQIVRPGVVLARLRWRNLLTGVADETVASLA